VGAVAMSGGLITNCLFDSNICIGGSESGSLCAALYASGTTIISCTFINNQNRAENARYSGGALLVYDGIVNNCYFNNNFANGGDSGGALYSNKSQISDCYFVGNSINEKEYGAGGAVSFSTDFVNCIFKENKGGNYWYNDIEAGAVSSRGKNSFTSCLFVGNISKMTGALTLQSNDYHVTNCTFFNNHSEYYGGILLNNTQVPIKNTIIYGNYPRNIHYLGSGQINASYSAIEDTLALGVGNIKLEFSPFQSIIATDNCFLNDTSFCINAGDTVGISKFLKKTDIFGKNRIVKDTIDIGAIEYYNRLTPVINWPTINEATYGNSLNDAINDDGTANIEGYFYIDTTLILNAGVNFIPVIFSPKIDSILKYKSTVENLSVIVDKSIIHLIAMDTTVNHGDVEPEYEIRYQGFKLGEDIEVIDQKPTVFVNNYSELGAGEHIGAIQVVNGYDNNYDFSYTNGTLTILENLSGIEEGSLNLSVFPNPFSDKLIVEKSFGIIEYALIDIKGQQILFGKEFSSRLQLDLSKIKSGLYILRISADGKTSNFRVVKK
jgi:hypothetical protein